MRYVSGPYTQAQLIKDINEVETSLTNRFNINGVITDATEQRNWREKVEDVSFGRNTVLFDDQGNPSVMVEIPTFTELDVLVGSRNIPHPTFIVNGAVKKLYIAKYQCITTGSGATLRAISLKGKDPRVNINHTDAMTACKQNGTGWHLITNAEWAAIALQAKAKGFYPRGNNSYGKDHAVTTEKGVATYIDGSNIGRTATGSGPISWSHDGSPFGIWDMNGNVWEWNSGMRLNAGEIQIIPDNNAADNTLDQSATSALWRAILPSGTLCHTKWVASTSYALNTVIAPGNGKTYICTTAGTSGSTQPTWPDADTVTDGGAVWTYQTDVTLKYPNGSKGFKDVTLVDGVTPPNITKLLGLTPLDNTDTYGSDYFYVNISSERVPFRGGGWFYSSFAGLFSLGLVSARSSADPFLGFRSAFYV